MSNTAATTDVSTVPPSCHCHVVPTVGRHHVPPAPVGDGVAVVDVVGSAVGLAVGEVLCVADGVGDALADAVEVTEGLGDTVDGTGVGVGKAPGPDGTTEFDASDHGPAVRMFSARTRKT
jgi:hypothetical protein